MTTKRPKKTDGFETTRYCRGFTIPRTVPAGRVLVHNHVRPVYSVHGIRPERAGERVAPGDLFQGLDGFRAWTQVKSARLVRCNCGWAPLVPVHYHFAFRGFRQWDAAVAKDNRRRAAALPRP